jgi:hypothetical protein
MDDVSLVEVVEAGQDLADKVADESLFEGAVVAEEGGDGTAGNICADLESRLFCRSSVRTFEENIEVSAIGRRVEVLNDVGVLERLEELDLALQSGEHRLLPLLIGRVARWQLDLLDSHEVASGRDHACASQVTQASRTGDPDAPSETTPKEPVPMTAPLIHLI